MVISSSNGNLEHAEVKFGDGYLVIAGEWTDLVASLGSLGGKNASVLHVISTRILMHIANASGQREPKLFESPQMNSTAIARTWRKIPKDTSVALRIICATSRVEKRRKQVGLRLKDGFESRVCATGRRSPLARRHERQRRAG